MLPILRIAGSCARFGCLREYFINCIGFGCIQPFGVKLYSRRESIVYINQIRGSSFRILRSLPHRQQNRPYSDRYPSTGLIVGSRPGSEAKNRLIPDQSPQRETAPRCRTVFIHNPSILNKETWKANYEISNIGHWNDRSNNRHQVDATRSRCPYWDWGRYTDTASQTDIVVNATSGAASLQALRSQGAIATYSSMECDVYGTVQFQDRALAAEHGGLRECADSPQAISRPGVRAAWPDRLS
jgi:hypothetical protein